MPFYKGFGMSERLKGLIETLFGEKGCIWAKEQTLKSMCPIFLEEAHELIEAIDTEDPRLIAEELADFLYNALFLIQVAERSGLIQEAKLIADLCDKLERRHVHVFGDQPVQTMQELGELYEGIKRAEKKERTSVLDGVPKSLGALARGQKILDRISRCTALPKATPYSSEEELEEALVDLLLRAHHSGFDPETQLHRLIGRKKEHFFARQERENQVK